MDEKDKQTHHLAIDEATTRHAGSRMSGRRNALPAGTLPGPYMGVQGDEHRDPDQPLKTLPFPEARETVANHLMTEVGKGKEPDPTTG